MKLAGIIGTVLLSLMLAAPVYAQEQHEQEEQKDQKDQKEQTTKPAQDEKKAQPEKSAKQDEKAAEPGKNAKPEEKNAQQQHAQPAKNAGGRIPADRYKANFGREHTFRVSQGDYNNHRFQYGGYWFGFAAPWPGNWLYTQNVFVVDIGGVYYLCNPTYPGVNVELSITL
jgi:cobalamin biosynthesis protein CobT